MILEMEHTPSAVQRSMLNWQGMAQPAMRITLQLPPQKARVPPGYAGGFEGYRPVY